MTTPNICQCGHAKKYHFRVQGSTSGDACSGCNCLAFTPTAPTKGASNQLEVILPKSNHPSPSRGLKKLEMMVRIPEKNIMGALWCIKCLPRHEYAHVVYRGSSLCLEHFKPKLHAPTKTPL